MFAAVEWRPRYAVIGLLGVALLGLLLIPLLPTLAVLWGVVGSLRLTPFEFADSRQMGLFLRSLGIAFSATLFAIPWGVSTGYMLAHGRGWVARVTELLVLLPLLLPKIVIVMGWVYAFGNTGFFSRWTDSIFGLEGSLAWIDLYSPLGAGWVLALCYFPVLSLFCAQGLRRIDLRADRAAALVASPWRRLLVVHRGALLPPFATGLVIVFLLCFADYAVPSALMVNGYAVEIFSRTASFLDSSRALTVAVPPLLLVVLLLVSKEFLGARAVRRSARQFVPRDSTSGPLGRARIVRAVAFFTLSIAVVLPFGVLIERAGPIANYREALRVAGREFLTSVTVAGMGALLLVLLALAIVALHARISRAWQRSVELVLLATLLVPGSVVGLGILTLIDAGVWPMADLRSHTILTSYASLCRYLIFPTLLLMLAWPSSRDASARAARVAGAGAWQTFTILDLPRLAPVLLVAAALSFVLPLGELTAAALVNPPGGMTLSVRLSSLLHFGEESLVAALCLVQSAFLVGVLVLARLLAPFPWTPRGRDDSRAALASFDRATP